MRKNEGVQSSSHIIGIDASRAARAKRTGTETYSLELIKALAKIATSKHRLRLYTSHPPQHNDWPTSPREASPHEASSRVALPYVETRVIPWPRLWTHLRLAAELQQHPPDVLFVPAHVLPIYCPMPAVVTVHDLGYIHYPAAHRPFDRWYLNWTTRRHCHVARHIMADSQATRDDLVNYYGANPERITVVYLGRDENLAPVTDPEIISRAKAQYNIDGDYLLYLGTLHPRKNLVRLIEAFHLMRDTLPAAHRSLKLVIAGQKGWLYEDIFAKVQTLGLEQQVIFPGFIAAEDKPALLSGALAYVFPSLYEGFGLPVLEAMACGTPVLTSQVSSLPEVAGDAALLVDPHHPEVIARGLIRLITNSTLRRQLVGRGFEQIKKFSWERAAAHVLEILVSTVIS
jgi:glycosyltransferase involved in cell wall biosynthesis